MSLKNTIRSEALNAPRRRSRVMPQNRAFRRLQKRRPRRLYPEDMTTRTRSSSPGDMLLSGVSSSPLRTTSAAVGRRPSFFQYLKRGFRFWNGDCAAFGFQDDRNRPRCFPARFWRCVSIRPPQCGHMPYSIVSSLKRVAIASVKPLPLSGMRRFSKTALAVLFVCPETGRAVPGKFTPHKVIYTPHSGHMANWGKAGSRSALSLHFQALRLIRIRGV